MPSMDITFVRLIVGGTVFMTTKNTLLNSSWFKIFFSDKHEDEYFIDRNPDIFPDVLEYLRNDGNIALSYFKGNKDRFDMFVHECEYFGITVTEKWPKKPKKRYVYNAIYKVIHAGIDYMGDIDIDSYLGDEGYELIKMTSINSTNSDGGMFSGSKHSDRGIVMVFRKEI